MIKKLYGFGICLLLLCSCSIYTPFFIQNHSSEKVEVKITVDSRLKEFVPGDSYKLLWREGFVKPKKFHKGEAPGEIDLIPVNDSVMVVTLPENSTVRLISAHNFSFENIVKSIELNGKKMTMNEILEDSERKGGRFLYVFSGE